jgi:hypothetical protein
MSIDPNRHPRFQLNQDLPAVTVHGLETTLPSQDIILILGMNEDPAQERVANDYLTQLQRDQPARCSWRNSPEQIAATLKHHRGLLTTLHQDLRRPLRPLDRLNHSNRAAHNKFVAQHLESTLVKLYDFNAMTRLKQGFLDISVALTHADQIPLRVLPCSAELANQVRETLALPYHVGNQTLESAFLTPQELKADSHYVTAEDRSLRCRLPGLVPNAWNGKKNPLADKRLVIPHRVLINSDDLRSLFP